MKLPKEHITFFLDLPINDYNPEAGFELKQINLYLGNKWNYWFIQPSEVPLKHNVSTFPSILLKHYDFVFLRNLTREKYNQYKVNIAMEKKKFRNYGK